MKLNPNLVIAGMLVGMLVVGEGMGLLYFKNKSGQLSQSVKKLEVLKPQYEKMSEIEKDLKSQNTDLWRENEAMKLDRENLLSQTKNMLADRTRVAELQETIEKMTQEQETLLQEKAASEKAALALKDEIAQKQEAQAQLAQERDNFKEAYEKARKGTVVNDLKKQIAGLEKDKEKLQASLDQKGVKIEQAEGGRAKALERVRQLEAEVKGLRKKIAEAFAKNKKLEQEVFNVPKKFAEIGRQNKMLLKETAQMHYNLGVFYTKNKEYRRAIAEFQKVVDINPDDAYAHFNLGYIYAEYLVDRPKAIEQFRHYLKLAKSDDKDIDWVQRYLLTWETFEGKKPME